MNSVDGQYINILKNVIENGVEKYTRAGRVKSLFAKQIRVDLRYGFPLLTTKKIFTRGMIHELLWFLKGSTNIKYLIENDVHIWDDDAFRWYNQWISKNIISKDKIIVKVNGVEDDYRKLYGIPKEEFLDNVMNEVKVRVTSRENGSYKEYTFGDLGDIYGKQWRNFGVSGRDQIQSIIDSLRNNPNDRRMICVAFNPDVLDDVALPPCHVMFQFYTRELSEDERKFLAETGEYDKDNIPKRSLSCMWTQRSGDLFLGIPINIGSYALLTHMIAKVVNMVPEELIGSIGDCHVYLGHMDAVKEQISRQGSQSLPKLVIHGEHNDIDSFKYDDFEFIGYNPDPVIKAPLFVGS